MNHKNRGFTLIEVLIVLSVIIVLVSISMLILGLHPVRTANEASAIASVRTLITAEKIYMTTKGRSTYGDLPALSADSLIDPPLAAGNRRGYSFTLSAQPYTFTITATPHSNRDGLRSFFADHTGVIRARAGAGAGPGDPPIGN